MNLNLVRIDKTSTYTVGRLAIDGVFFCHTLERAADGRNIPNESAINEGTYPVKKRWSHHFGKDVLGLCDVAGRSDIEIHSANLPSELKGCIAVGFTVIGEGFLGQSTQAFNDLMRRFQEPCALTIESAMEKGPA